MDVRQLTYFLAIVDHGGFSRAAAHLRVAQPSLSQSMRNFERQLGVTLFRRAGRGVVLSDAAEALVEPARQVLRDVRSAEDVVQSIRGHQRGHVDIASMPSPGIEPLTSMLAEFVTQYPHVTVSVDGSFTADEVVDAVRGGTAEVGLLGQAEHRPIAGLGVLALADQPLMLLSLADTEFASATRVSRHELAGLRLVVSPHGSLMRQLVDDVLAEGVAAEIAVEVSHRTSLLALAAAGVGHAVMPSAWAQLAVRSGLVARRIEPVVALRTSLVHRTDGLTPASRAFLATAARHAQLVAPAVHEQ